MITVTIRFSDLDDDFGGVQAQLMVVPRIGETISCPDTDGIERDLRVIGVNHWVKPFEKHLQQVEIVIFCKPANHLYGEKL